MSQKIAEMKSTQLHYFHFRKLKVRTNMFIAIVLRFHENLISIHIPSVLRERVPGVRQFFYLRTTEERIYSETAPTEWF